MTDPTIRSQCPITIPDRWTPEQALAVVEFIGDLRQAIWAHYGDLREAIWAHYHEELTEAYRERKLSEPVRPLPGTPPDDNSCGCPS
jgi:hypothetical protein